MKRRIKKFLNMPSWSSLMVTFIAALIISVPLTAAILPEDRADALYHSYEGGGVKINGPSIMARKEFGTKASFMANYYVDFVTSASIDVETYASPYTEQRNEYSLAMDYLEDKTTMSLSYTNSLESDYAAGTYNFGVSHDMFGDLTTVSLGYARGSDKVGQNVYAFRDDGSKFIKETLDKGDIGRRNYRLGLSQILTKNFIMSLGYELITDEGFLNNPYRRVALADQENPDNPPELRSVLYTAEQYPKTRTSNAFGVRGKYYLPWKGVLHGEYRSFSDSWDIKADIFDVGYTQRFGKRWIVDLHYRGYSQTAASFYSDLFLEEKVYMARDKELSKFTDTTIGGSVSFDFLHKGWWVFDRGSINLSYDVIQFDYENFTDQRDVQPVVSEYLKTQPYSFSADVIRFYMSVWY